MKGPKRNPGEDTATFLGVSSGNLALSCLAGAVVVAPCVVSIVGVGAVRMRLLQAPVLLRFHYLESSRAFNFLEV